MSRPLPSTVLAALCLAITLACSGDGGGGPKPALVATFQGVLGGDDGVETGTFLLKFLDDNTGTGTFTVEGGSSHDLDVSVNGSNFTATGGGIGLAGTYTATDLTGTYTGGAGGAIAGFKKLSGNTYTLICAAHSGSAGDGVYSFIWNEATHDLKGVWSTVGVSFAGIVSGEDANPGGSSATMSGHTGTVDIFPSSGPPVSLSGFYTLGSGESGTMNGTACTSGPQPAIIAVFEGVIGGNNGTEDGSFTLNFLSDNTGNGSVSIGGGVAQALGVTVSGNSFSAIGGGISFSGTFTTDDLDGTYNNSSGGGLLAAFKKVGGTNFLRFCATHSGSEGNGVYSFVWNPANHKLHGLWTTGGTGGAFKGIISGEDGNAGGAGAAMSGQTGTVTILPNQGPPATLGGFYDLGSSTISGSMGGTTCP